MMVYVGTLDLAVSGDECGPFIGCVLFILPATTYYYSSSPPPLSQAVNTVQQTVLIVHEEDKKSYVFDFIRNMLPLDKVLIFVGKKLV